MSLFKEFYREVEDVSNGVFTLINVLELYYDLLAGECCNKNTSVLCDLLYIINHYADHVADEMRNLLEKNMINAF